MTEAPLAALSAVPAPASARSSHRIEGKKSIPFFLVHVVAAVTPFFTGVTWEGLAWALGAYAVVMFGITAGFHRYFSHRAYKTSRAFQFVLALLGTFAAQKGVLWWASNHRHHHKYSDEPEDIHSPKQDGFWWSHVGWILSDRYDATVTERVPDLVKFRELRWLNDNYLVVQFCQAWAMYLLGGWTGLLWGFFVGTVLLWHGTFTINSLAHVIGRRRYETTDTSKNSFLLALITHGEGWHNNHHHYQSSTRQGFYWWELDVSWYVLRALAAVGVVWDLREPPRHVREGWRLARAKPAEARAAAAEPPPATATELAA